MIKLALAAILLGGSASMNVSAAGRKAEKPMEWKGQYGGPIDAGTEVATDESSWTRLWLQLGQDAPALDFKKYFAVAVFAGERPTGGYTVEFLDPVPKGADVTVYFRVKDPAGFSTQAVAQPWKVRAFERVKGKVFVMPAPKEGRKK